MTENETALLLGRFESLREELPRCARHRESSQIDCVECMYLSTHIYAPLEEIEIEFRRMRAALEDVAAGRREFDLTPRGQDFDFVTSFWFLV